MCFEVILSHFWTDTYRNLFLKIIYKFRIYPVPVFMVLSFFLMHDFFENMDKTAIKRRIYRVLWPQIGWTFIYAIVLIASELISGVRLNIRLQDVILQLLTGHSPVINESMWYQVVLLIITLLFIAAFALLGKKRAAYVLGIFALISLIMQYSGLNNMIYGNMMHEFKYPLGRIAEMLPCAYCGYILSYYPVKKALKEKKIVFIPIVVLILIATVFAKEHIHDVEGFGYAGICMLMTAVSVVILFFTIPTELITGRLRDALLFASKYTLGIYCMHRLIALFVNNIIMHTANQWMGRFSVCVLIYIVCFIIALLMSQIKSERVKNLFE